MTPDSTLTFDRARLAEALRTLTPEELQLLLVLALGSCPRTRRLWTTPLRLTDQMSELPTPRRAHVSLAGIDAMLSVLLGRDHVSLYARSHGALCSYEVTSLCPRHADEPPANLPVEPAV